MINLKTQLSYYKKVESWLREKLSNDEGKLILSRAVYLFSIGSNDYTSPFLTNSTVLNSFSKSQYIGMVIGNLTRVLKVTFSFHSFTYKILRILQVLWLKAKIIGVICSFFFSMFSGNL